jgi:hypothetical protein
VQDSHDLRDARQNRVAGKVSGKTGKIRWKNKCRFKFAPGFFPGRLRGIFTLKMLQATGANRPKE